MKKRMKKLILPCSLCAVCIAVVLIGAVYFSFISKHIYEDSTNYLKEIYGQVNRTFGLFAQRNWRLLRGWNEQLSQADSNALPAIEGFLEKEKQDWGFSDFYLLV